MQQKSFSLVLVGKDSNGELKTISSFDLRETCGLFWVAIVFVSSMLLFVEALMITL